MIFTFFVLDRKYPSQANLVKKPQNSYFKLRFIILTSLNMQNSMVVFAFSNLEGKFPFRADLLQKIKVKICFKINLDMQNSMVMFTFSIFD